MNSKTVLSCIQPTGDMHFGNYFGAVKNWVDLQDQYNCIYGIVNYHAMTAPYNSDKLRTNTWDLVMNLLSVGIKKENLFIQSLVPEHAELCWIFNCFCSYGYLTRMTQFKDKSRQQKESGKDDYISVGLLDYPVLQTADILIYNADFVPVGKDQEQHLELARDIAQRFNNQVGKEYFKLPQPLFTETPKIKSTADPSRKMSKSAGEKHFISLFSEDKRIIKQIKSAVTDSGLPSNEMSEGLTNLFELLKASGNQKDYDSLLKDYHSETLKYGELKECVAETLVNLVKPFKEKKGELLENKREVKYQIKESSARIRKITQQTIKEVKELTGLLNVKM